MIYDSEMNDKEATISDLLKIVTAFRDERGWDKYHAPRNLATSIVLESSELLELFQWDMKALSSSQVKKDKARMEEIKKELADILIYCLSLSDILGIDVAESIIKKLEHNRVKYPVKHFNKKSQDLSYYKKVKAKYRLGRKTK